MIGAVVTAVAMLAAAVLEALQGEPVDWLTGDPL